MRTRAMRTAGLAGGEGFQAVMSIAYAPPDPSVVYMVVDTGQVWRSRDGGATWQRVASGFYANGGLYVAVDPEEAETAFLYSFPSLWMWRERSKDWPGYPLGIYRTRDGGESWELVRALRQRSSGYRYRGGDRFAFAGGVVYAATETEGLLRSSDGGDSWKPFALAGRPVLGVAVRRREPLAPVVSTTDGLWEVHAGGKATAVAVHPSEPSVVVAIDESARMYHSTDGGRTFSVVLEHAKGDIQARYVEVSLGNLRRVYVSFGPKPWGRAPAGGAVVQRGRGAPVADAREHGRGERGRVGRSVYGRVGGRQLGLVPGRSDRAASD